MNWHYGEKDKCMCFTLASSGFVVLTIKKGHIGQLESDYILIIYCASNAR